MDEDNDEVIEVERPSNIIPRPSVGPSSGRLEVNSADRHAARKNNEPLPHSLNMENERPPPPFSVVRNPGVQVAQAAPAMNMNPIKGQLPVQHPPSQPQSAAPTSASESLSSPRPAKRSSAHSSHDEPPPKRLATGNVQSRYAEVPASFAAPATFNIAGCTLDLNAAYQVIDELFRHMTATSAQCHAQMMSLSIGDPRTQTVRDQSQAVDAHLAYLRNLILRKSIGKQHGHLP
jgi:hypothetical protein